jgi:hypothetical protein
VCWYKSARPTVPANLSEWTYREVGLATMIRSNVFTTTVILLDIEFAASQWNVILLGTVVVGSRNN